MQEKYESQIREAMKEKFGYSNPMTIPRLEKVTVNMGIGGAVQDKKHLEIAYQAMTDLAGQKPVTTKARKSIAGFKLRQGMAIGCMVTMRRQRMYEFMDRLITLALPRVRDFRGIPDRSFDGRGNYTLGIKEQIVFPEINVDSVGTISGLDVTFVTTAKTDEEALALLKALGMPFVRRDAA